MSQESLQVALRESRGSRGARKERAQGLIPAVLYGHGGANVTLLVPRDQVGGLIRRGAHLVELRGALSESALVKKVQWDSLGSQVLHLDLARVDAAELVKIKLSVVLRGEAAGVKAGGRLNHVLHDVEIECPAAAIPEKLFVRVHDLAIGGVLHASDIELPAGAKLLAAPDEVVVQCVAVAVAADEAAEAPLPGAAEPELIGRKPKEDEEEE